MPVVGRTGVCPYQQGRMKGNMSERKKERLLEQTSHRRATKKNLKRDF